MNTGQVQAGHLPLTRKPTFAYVISVLIAAFMAAASLAGLLYPAVSYPTQELREAFMPNDAVNLVIGVPILLVSMGLARRARLAGLLLWPGALFYAFYTYTVYIFIMPLNAAFLLHLTLVMLSAYALIGLVAAIDGATVRQRLSGAVPARAGGGILAALAALFLVRVVVTLAGALVSRTPIAETEMALHMTDFLLTPAWIIGGVLLWRRQALGYVAGLGLLFQASMLFIGLIAVFILQPFLVGAPFRLFDVLVVAAMGLVTFVPLALFLRGAAAR